MSHEIIENIVETDGCKMFTSSLIVAESFGKVHKNVLRDIENLQCSPEFRQLNFEHTSYVHPQNGETYPAYRLTRDGFSFLAMGFTGKKAAVWKEKFLMAFNAMEQALLRKALPGADDALQEENEGGPHFTPASSAQVKGLRGLLAFWSSVEGLPEEELEDRVWKAHGLPSIDYLQDWDLSEWEWYIVKSIYRASGQVTEGEATENTLRVLNGLLDYGSGLREIPRSILEGIVCEMCSVHDLTHLTPVGARKAELLLWAFLNRYPTRKDCLSQAKYIFDDI